MITECVTKERIKYWEKIWLENAATLKPNRISGILLHEYFVKKYSPTRYEDADFVEAVRLNLTEECGEKAAEAANIVCYLIDEDVYIGIDLNTGFFHIESNDTKKCVSIYDDLFVKRGLNNDDLQNFVYVGQYIELSGG